MDSAMAATLSPVSLLTPVEWDTHRPGIDAGPLNTMPQDLVCPILCDLSIDDIANLAATNVLTFVAYITAPGAATSPLSCRSVVRAMRFARANKGDEHATMHALTHITCQDVRLRPGLLWQLSQALPGMAAIQDGATYKAWETACAGAHKDWRLCFDTEMPVAPSYHLEVADWQARFYTALGTQRQVNTAALDRMVAQPLALWPALMEAFAAQGVSVPDHLLTQFIDSFQGCLFGISDLFATKLATALFYDKKQTDIKNTLCRLGVSDRQLRCLSMPRLAASPLSSAAEWDIDRPGIFAWPLNTMSQNPICAILQELSIDDIGNLAATNVLTYVMYITESVADSMPLSCRGVVRAIRFARAHKDDGAATMRALTYISCQDVRMRPSLLGQLAQAIPGMAVQSYWMVSKAWNTACADAYYDWQLRFKTEMPAAPSYRLEMADWQARFSIDPEMQYTANMAALNRMAGLPPTLWPTLIQAFADQGILVPGDVLATFIDTFQGCLFGISDLFAIELANELFYDETRTNIKNTLCRLGVSDRQFHDILIPNLVEGVANALFRREGPLRTAVARWDVNGEDLDALVRSAYLRRLRKQANQRTA